MMQIQLSAISGGNVLLMGYYLSVKIRLEKINLLQFSEVRQIFIIENGKGTQKYTFWLLAQRST